MMKHGTILLALMCWSAAGLSAADLSIPASTGMRQGAAPQALTPDELMAIEGGNLLLDVDRNTQMMTVTRITPGNYDNIQCYSVKVTTSVVRETDRSASLTKGSMENNSRTVASGTDQVSLKQFPTGSANLSPSVGSQAGVPGPVIKTNASQTVYALDKAGNAVGQKSDSGYNIHYVDPAKSTNTLGCIGVQSQAGMAQVANSLKVDNASYASGAAKVQTVSVNSYTNNTPPPASTFKATEVKSTPAPKPAPKPTPTPAPKKFFFGLF